MTLNSLVNFDLHIHSVASAYKESGGIVAHSTANNLDVLMSALEERAINMFSITDHNRFDSNLYKMAIQAIESNEYPSVLSILPGVEFDVQFDDNKSSCHIITIFNAENMPDDLDIIEACIENEKLIKKEDKYTQERFELLLDAIGLETILIAHQFQGFDAESQRKHSLGDAVLDGKAMVCHRYIDGLSINVKKHRAFY